eukprot:6177362-Pleurochrysis_carterae.AAC.2
MILVIAGTATESYDGFVSLRLCASLSPNAAAALVCCDMCYCWVCDVPAKTCAEWTVSASDTVPDGGDDADDLDDLDVDDIVVFDDDDYDEDDDDDRYE